MLSKILSKVFSKLRLGEMHLNEACGAVSCSDYHTCPRNTPNCGKHPQLVPAFTPSVPRRLMGRFHRSQICVKSSFIRFILHGGTCLHHGHCILFVLSLQDFFVVLKSKSHHNLRRRRRIQKSCDDWLKWKKKCQI